MGWEWESVWLRGVGEVCGGVLGGVWVWVGGGVRGGEGGGEGGWVRVSVRERECEGE